MVFWRHQWWWRGLHRKAVITLLREGHHSTLHSGGAYVTQRAKSRTDQYAFRPLATLARQMGLRQLNTIGMLLRSS